MKKDNKSSIVSLLLVLAVIAVGLFWFKPNWDEQSALKVTEQVRLEEKAGVEATLKGLQEAQANLSASSEITQQTVLASIPERMEQDHLIDQISKVAKDNDVNLSSISFNIPINSTEAIKKAGINLSMTGGEDDLMRLLKGLESNPRKLLIKSITVQFGQTEGIKRVNFNISMDAYFQTGI